MIQRLFVSITAALLAVTVAHAASEMPSRVLTGPAQEAVFFRAPDIRPGSAVALPAPSEKSAPVTDLQGRLRVGTVRALPKGAAVADWVSVPDGAVSRFTASSDGARGVRVAIQLGRLAAPVEIRAQGTDGRIEIMQVEPSSGGEIWTPWTEGDTQKLEVFTPAGAPVPAAFLTAVVHFDQSPLEKAAASSCTVPASCTTDNATLDAAIAERSKSSVRITFVEGSSAFLCSATLINSPAFPAGYLLTANHCVSTAASANSVTTFWFYEPTSCFEASLAGGSVQVSGGTQLVFTNYNPDSTLLRMVQSPPAGAVYSAWNATRLSTGDPIVSISHPHGDTTRLALGAISREYRITGRAQDEYGVLYSRGIIEGGSSGSGLFTLSGGSLVLRGILTGTTIRGGTGLSCTNLEEEGLYGRFDIFYPEIAAYLNGGVPAVDDTPNRIADWANIPADTATLNNRTVTADRRIEYVGDVDIFRFTLSSTANVTLQSQGSMDTVGTLLDGNGKFIVTNDDVSGSDTNFGITRTLDPGTYYVLLAPWAPEVTGAYRMVMTATTVATPSVNYTDLWWSVENGWGINLAHQGNTLFGTLYTYDNSGTPMWLYMSNGDRQTDGSYSGTLYRAVGPGYSSPSWSTPTSTPVGTMRLTFDSNSTGTLVYTVNGVSVTKTIRRFVFSSPGTTCATTDGDRTGSSNFQDLWWNPQESGWGLNIAQQGNILFALLYIYDTNGQPLWLSMSNGAFVTTRTWSGALYAASGPAFNANPWSSATQRQIGSMTLSFTDGETGTLTYTVNGAQVVKSIRRTVFANPKPLCSSP